MEVQMKILAMVAISFFLPKGHTEEFIDICDRGIVGELIAEKLGSHCSKVSVEAMSSLKDLELYRPDGSDDTTPLKPGAFQGLSSLEYLRIDNFDHITPGTFSGLDSLEKLVIDFTDLTTAKPGILTGLDSLKHLDIRSSPIVENPDLSGLFIGPNSLQSLFINETDLNRIPPGFFKGIENLISFTIHIGELSIPDGVIDGNKLAGLKELRNLKHLGVTQHYIEIVRADTFSTLTNLISLSLEYNAITYIEPDTFKNLKSLENLDLYENLKGPVDLSETGLRDGVKVCNYGSCYVKK